jgi:hypothetical protein
MIEDWCNICWCFPYPTVSHILLFPISYCFPYPTVSHILLFTISYCFPYPTVYQQYIYGISRDLTHRETCLACFWVFTKQWKKHCEMETLWHFTPVLAWVRGPGARESGCWPFRSSEFMFQAAYIHMQIVLISIRGLNKKLCHTANTTTQCPRNFYQEIVNI